MERKTKLYAAKVTVIMGAFPLVLWASPPDQLGEGWGSGRIYLHRRNATWEPL